MKVRNSTRSALVICLVLTWTLVSAPATAQPPAEPIVISVDGTTEAATSDAPDGSPGSERPIAIGEGVTYRLEIVLPESTSISFGLESTLPDGLEFISGSARVSYLADTLPSFSADFAGIPNSAEPALTFPSGRVSFDTGTRTLSFDFGSIINNDGDAGEEFIVVEFDLVVIDDAINSVGYIVSTEAQSIVDEGLPTETIASSNEVVLEIVEPVVSMAKQFTPDLLVRGSTTVLTIVVNNLAAIGATGAIFDVSISDILDDWLDVTAIGVTFNAAAVLFGSTFIDTSTLTPGFATGVTDHVAVTISGLPVDGAATISVTLHVDPNADPLLLSRTITNTAVLIGDSLESDAVPDDEDRAHNTNASDDLNVVKPTLLLTKTDNVDPAAAGASISYSVMVQNSGTSNFPATGVSLTDQIPPGFSVTDVAPSQGGCDPLAGGIISCTLGTIPSGASATVVISGTYPSTTLSGTIPNNIAYVVSAEGNHGNDGNDTPTDNDDERAEEPTTILRQVDVALAQSVDDPSPAVGQLVTFGLDLINNGPSQATNVVVTDSVPAGLTYVRFLPETLPCTYAAPTITCAFPTLDVATPLSIAVEVTVDAGTLGGPTMTNAASVTSVEPETDLSNNSASAAVTTHKKVTLAVDTPTISEEGGIAVITATLESPNDTGASLAIPLVVGLASTASMPGDFTLASPVITIGEGLSSGTVALTGVSDSVVEADETAQLVFGSLPPLVSAGSPAEVTISITSEDLASLIVSQSGGSTEVAESGGEDTILVALSAQPSQNVTVSLSTGTQIMIDPVVLTFTGGDWDTPQTITVAAVVDLVYEGTHADMVSYAMSSGDEDFNASGTPTDVIIIDGISEVLANGGFEIAGVQAIDALGWKLANRAGRDRRVCNTPAKPDLAYAGACAFRIAATGLGTNTRVLSQTFRTPEWGDAGDTLDFSAQINGNKLNAGTRLILNVRYTDGSRDKQATTIPAGTTPYSLYAAHVDLTKRVSKVKVRLVVGPMSSGTLWIDSASLLYTPGTSVRRDGSTSQPLPPPIAPSGFRVGN